MNTPEPLSIKLTLPSEMKQIYIRKDKNYSINSNVKVFIRHKHILSLNDYNFHKITLQKEGDYFRLKHQWTQSSKIYYHDVINDTKIVFTPILNKKLIYILLPVAVICVALWIYGKFRWAGFPLIPFAIYIFYHLLIKPNNYIRIKLQ